MEHGPCLFSITDLGNQREQNQRAISPLYFSQADCYRRAWALRKRCHRLWSAATCAHLRSFVVQVVEKAQVFNLCVQLGD